MELPVFHRGDEGTVKVAGPIKPIPELSPRPSYKYSL